MFLAIDFIYDKIFLLSTLKIYLSFAQSIHFETTWSIINWKNKTKIKNLMKRNFKSAGRENNKQILWFGIGWNFLKKIEHECMNKSDRMMGKSLKWGMDKEILVFSSSKHNCQSPTSTFST